MQPSDPRAFLWDLAESARAIEIFTLGMNAQSYADSALVNAAVERKFKIIGEALNQLSKSDAAMAARIPDVSKIMAFRNQLIHSYAGIDSSLVWNIVQQSLPELLLVVTALLDEQDSV